MGDLEPLSSLGLGTGAADVNGNAYARSIYFSSDKIEPQNSAEYNLGRHWRTMTATIGLRDDSPTGCELRFDTFADGKPINSETLSIGESQDLKLDITHVLRMKFQVTYVSTADVTNYCYGVWGDARLAS
ncbi:NPCBM/NEW2 domain-containing protein [Streptomyces sp. NBC_01622]|uniref:NPCBM/NEW2 domain-containing protein n=1 Tax=Streptomyces sp. NBC_01622 TaxID=2975903 RepID=UPI00386A9066|nr:NPCBM/NEW2 domain-containing protein [Streptomyces sp. NBC_01622]